MVLKWRRQRERVKKNRSGNLRKYNASNINTKKVNDVNNECIQEQKREVRKAQSTQCKIFKRGYKGKTPYETTVKLYEKNLRKRLPLGNNRCERMKVCFKETQVARIAVDQ